jgi:hypothetical protein
MKALGMTTMEDGFSNMIRNGKMTRDEAMQTISAAQWGERTDALDRLLAGLEVPAHLKASFYDYLEEFRAAD